MPYSLTTQSSRRWRATARHWALLTVPNKGSVSAYGNSPMVAAHNAQRKAIKRGLIAA